LLLKHPTAGKLYRWGAGLHNGEVPINISLPVEFNFGVILK